MAWAAALVLAGVGWACDPGSPATVDAAIVDASIARASTVGAAEPGASNPLGELVPPAPGEESLEGVVAQHLPAGGYTYLRIEPERGEPRWVVTMRRDVGPGDRVRVDSLGSRHDFYSRRLDRRFAELVFGVVEKLG